MLSARTVYAGGAENKAEAEAHVGEEDMEREENLEAVVRGRFPEDCKSKVMGKFEEHTGGVNSHRRATVIIAKLLHTEESDSGLENMKARHLYGSTNAFIICDIETKSTFPCNNRRSRHTLKSGCP